MLAGTQFACLGTFGLRGPAVETEAAKALVPAERSVMVQPDQGMSSGVGTEFIALCDGSLQWKVYQAVLGFAPKRIELAPGVQRFFYGGGQSWHLCAFDLGLESGHVYQPQALNKLSPYCRGKGCTISLSDTAPDGQETELRRPCASGDPYLACSEGNSPIQ